MKKIFVLLIMMFAVALVPAHAQLGGIIGRAVSKGVEKAVQKARASIYEERCNSTEGFEKHARKL